MATGPMLPMRRHLGNPIASQECFCGKFATWLEAWLTSPTSGAFALAQRDVRLPWNADTIRGVFFLREGLSEAIRMAYGRDDLTARRASQQPAAPSSSFQDSTINLEWVSETPPLLRHPGPF